MSKSSDSTEEMETDQVSIERREQPRVAVNLAVTMTSDSNFYVGFADNVSEGGLFVATHELLPIGDTIDLEFRLPDQDEPFEVKAEICWHRTVSDRRNGVLPGFGARFVDLDDEDHDRLQSFVDDREPLFHPE
ncbi:MAG: TIGR02266 family protein [Persicimonas sp.]